MIISEAINLANDLRPGNRIGNEIKRRWLFNLDTRILEDIVLAHEGAEVDSIGDYITEDCTLLASDIYSDMYVWYLVSQMDAATGEGERYNYSIDRFNALYRDFSAWYKRTHTPIQKHKLRNVMKIGGIK